MIVGVIPRVLKERNYPGAAAVVSRGVVGELRSRKVPMDRDSSVVARPGSSTRRSLPRIRLVRGFALVGLMCFGLLSMGVGDEQARALDGSRLLVSGAPSAVLLGSDRHGDVGYQFTSAGVVSATRVYDPLGATVGQTGALVQLGFQGDYTDPTSGDVWMGSRWYRPGTGGFASRDTEFGKLDTPVSLNRYTYGWADPIGMFDPDGRWPGWVDDAVDTVQHAVEAVTGGFEQGGGWIARALDIGEACTLCPVDGDGARVLSVDEVLANPEMLSPKASLTNFSDAFSQMGKSLARDAISSPYTAFSGRDINTLEKVSSAQRAIAVFETALSYSTVAVRLAGFVPRGAGFHFGNVEPDFNVNAPSRHTEHPNVLGGVESRHTSTSGPDASAPTHLSGANATNTANAAGDAYPSVIHPGTGEAIPYPGEGLTKVPVGERVPWGASERGEYIKQWYDEGLSTPEGGWSQYDIHHIVPREYGGTNAFENLVPVQRAVHQAEFNTWWRNYP